MSKRDAGRRQPETTASCKVSQALPDRAHRWPSQSRCDSQLPEQVASSCSGTSSGGERADEDTDSTLENALLSDEKLDLGFACQTGS